MIYRTFLLCVLLLYMSFNHIECKGGRSGGRSFGGRSHTHSSHSHSRPSSSGHGWSSSGSSRPSSVSGHSGSGSSHPSYPHSTGLSGSGSSYPSYPHSTGLSGSGTKHPSYPASTGLSGSGSRNPSYPASTGLSGSDSGHRGYAPPSTGSNNDYRPYEKSYNTNHAYGTNTYQNGYGSGTYHNMPTYHTSPQYVYITEYRNSESRYGDLLTGLTLYNLGRSHSHYHDHYYYDDYYRRRYNSPNSGHPSYNKPTDSANCILKIKENGKTEMLKIPCEIVSTFTEGSQKKVSQSYANTTVCVTNTTTVNNAAPVVESTTSSSVTTTKVSTSSPTDRSQNFSTTTPTPEARDDPDFYLSKSFSNNSAGNSSVATSIANLSKNFTSHPSNVPVSDKKLSVVPIIDASNKSIVATNISNLNISSGNNKVSSNVTVTNSTSCTTNVVVTDPLPVKGPPVNPSNMECTVEIHTQDTWLQHVVDCSTLMKYSKTPEPTKEPSMLPSRNKLKSWLTNPPWWLSTFIAV